MHKLPVGLLIVFVIVSTLVAGAAGFLFGANLGGNYGCFPFAGQSGYIACSYAFGLIGAGMGLVLSLVLGLLLKKMHAVVTMIVIVLVLFIVSALPPVIKTMTDGREPGNLENDVQLIDINPMETIPFNETSMPTELPDDAEETPVDAYADWTSYANGPIGYTFMVPPGAEVKNSGADRTVIQGPNGDWPDFEINHPDSDFFRPDAGVDVVTWINEYRTEFGGTPVELAPIKIAGRPTATYTQPRSPQAFAGTYYYFITGGQLFEILILDVNDEHDDHLYQLFLESFGFPS